MRSLLLGCGNSRVKHMASDGDMTWGDLTTLDIDPSTGCDVVHDLDVLPYPFPDDAFDEVHAYEVLEHCGKQGDWRFFFGQFSEIYRILKDGGFFFATVPSPSSPWTWGDPGHTRLIHPYALGYLDQGMYAQVGATPCTDYRPYWKGNFRVETSEGDGSLAIALRKEAA